MNAHEVRSILPFVMAGLTGFAVLGNRVAAESGVVQSAAPAVQKPSVHIRYSDEFASHYPEIVTAAPDLGAKTPLEPPLTLQSELKTRTATLLRSSVKVPYEDQIGAVTIKSAAGKKRILVFRGFRNVEMRWINDRLLFLSMDIGHVAGVEAIFDAETGQWLYRQSLEYLR